MLTHKDALVGQQLLWDVLDNPEDDAPRLIYADWLEEYGGEPERAEFIRCQVWESWEDPAYSMTYHNAGQRLSSMRPNVKRAAELLYKAWSGWFVYFYFPYDWEFQRGFLSLSKAGWKEWMNHGVELCQMHPISSISVSDRSPVDFLDESGVHTRGFRFYLNDGTGFHISMREHYVPAEMYGGFDEDGPNIQLGPYFPTKEEAIKDLGVRFLNWAKREAKKKREVK